VHPELEALLALQEKDRAVTATDEALAALAPEVSTLDEAHAAAERALAVARAGIQAAIDRRDELEGKIANYRSMQEQRRQRLEWVRGARKPRRSWPSWTSPARCSPKKRPSSCAPGTR